MQQLLSEREDIQSEYEQLEQEYMLVVSELNAARDRISKLLNHLERWVGRVRKREDEKEREGMGREWEGGREVESKRDNEREKERMGEGE